MPHLIIYSLSRHEPEGTALNKKEWDLLNDDSVKELIKRYKGDKLFDDRTLIIWLDGKLIHHQPGIHNYDACPIHPGSAYFLGNECETCIENALSTL